jgi:putative aldouronate transport system permease protein
MVLTILAAYPLSYKKSVFRAHDVIIALFLFAMLFDAGILAKYIVVRKAGLYDTFWALVVPSVFNPWHVILLMNFFRELPEELKEAAMVEGARHVDVLTLIYLPLAKPAIATLALFTGVMLWNEWFEPILYLRSPDLYPLQTYLRGIFTGARGSTNGLQGALTIVAILPLILVYPFIQRHFERGIVLGAVKQ